jgi:hypothetical protein
MSVMSTALPRTGHSVSVPSCVTHHPPPPPSLCPHQLAMVATRVFFVWPAVLALSLGLPSHAAVPEALFRDPPAVNANGAPLSAVLFVSFGSVENVRIPLYRGESVQVVSWHYCGLLEASGTMSGDLARECERVRLSSRVWTCVRVGKCVCAAIVRPSASFLHARRPSDPSFAKKLAATT